MLKRMNPWFAVVLAFMAIGIGSYIYEHIQSLYIPLIIVAIVFLLYKFPPNRWGKLSPRSATEVKRKQQGIPSKLTKRRASPFTVIEGRKNKDDEPPQYH